VREESEKKTFPCSSERIAKISEALSPGKRIFWAGKAKSAIFSRKPKNKRKITIFRNE
jgi:hypothetical protein